MGKVYNTCDCGRVVAPKRWELGYQSCLVCGDVAAKKVQHCVVPMNKSNYVVVTDPDVLKQLNPKRTM